jgi:prephenate dehydrogenase
MVFKQVTIIGTGLIGGSLGLALKKRRLAGRIVGCDRASVLERAGDQGAIDSGTTNPVDAVRGSALGGAGDACCKRFWIKSSDLVRR